MEKISANIWVISGNGGNVAVMPTSEGVLLVDDKFSQDAPDIVAKVKTVSDKPIRYVLNTHQHLDHTGGNEAMMRGLAEVVIHKNARVNMVAEKMDGLPRVTFDNEMQVFLGGKEVHARYLGRGHTNGDAVIYFPVDRVLHTGDLFVNGSVPYADYSANGSIIEWDKTLANILQLDFDTVIPGHGAIAKKADLAKWRQSLATLRSRAKAACATGTQDLIQRLNLPEIGMPDQQGVLFTFYQLFERNIPGLCQELLR
jgi:glyoxylase-like metal-dependent hydrolase (beta-lactamase superfamily II)